ncbi:DUF2960 domain-containing protein [Alginatibacterium sediminis]|uniref:DUF2960 domain-containing protein n=1 Tax=Alginatibacterium sediminis TaxID=2164068 RepID=A0A420ELT3_9ALTE|nr:DUF2960 domain-containing protein [Alginatibacterium sediminis]RKF21576.1 DUF2960 domain-containing protein [Alginatibacterium sediminis]
MARQIRYTYNNVVKTIGFANDRFNSLQEAVAAAEGVDLSNYLAMEAQVLQHSKGKNAMREFRDSEFKRMGFSNIEFIKD